MQQGDPYYFSDDFMNTSAPSALPRKRPLSLAQEVMNDLMGRIRTGHFKPGEKLPTEPEIMAEQGVSRTVVREALSRLQAAGLVETRHGVGTFVLADSAQPKRPLDFSTVVTLHDLLAMLELRISQLEKELTVLARQSPACTTLLSIPGIGLLTATAMVAAPTGCAARSTPMPVGPILRISRA